MFYRDRLRAARYATLADAEAFEEICYAVEGLGLRLHQKEAVLGQYRNCILELANKLPERQTLATDYPGCFTRFEALYRTLNKARNDAMHTGTYARHAASAAIELCIHLEEALMADFQMASSQVKDYMVKAPVWVEPWHPVAYARQLMLTHSFSFLPVYIDKGWKLLSEFALADFLHGVSADDRRIRLAMQIEAAGRSELCLEDANCIEPSSEIAELFGGQTRPASTLWLVVQQPRSDVLQGVLTPFELM